MAVLCFFIVIFEVLPKSAARSIVHAIAHDKINLFYCTSTPGLRSEQLTKLITQAELELASALEQAVIAFSLIHTGVKKPNGSVEIQ